MIWKKKEKEKGKKDVVFFMYAKADELYNFNEV